MGGRPATWTSFSIALGLSTCLCLAAGAPALAGGRDGRVLFEKGTAVFFHSDKDWEEVEADAAPGNPPGVDGLDLVATSLDRVKFEGKVYPLKREGLYRFVKFPSGVTNLIVRNDKNSLLPVLKGLSQLHIHGKKHDDLTDAAKKLETMPWIVQTCGPTRDLAITVLRKQAGFSSRKVDTLTGEKLSGFDDGHSLLEVYDPGRRKWILADIDMGLLFKHGDNFLNAYEFWKTLREKGEFEFVRLSQVEIDPEFSVALYFQLQTINPERVKDWYRRVFQIIAIDGEAMSWDEASRKRVVGLWGQAAVKLDKPDWVKKYYGSP
jgi:hypothetical protein